MLLCILLIYVLSICTKSTYGDNNGSIRKESSNERNYPQDEGEDDGDGDEYDGDDVDDDIDADDDKVLNMQGDVWLIS